MAKKKKKLIVPQTLPKAKEGISLRGKKIIAAGCGLLVIGYALLIKTDPYGQNLASLFSPFLIVGGYITIGIGILFPGSISDTNPFK
jgi:hypothetical protein